MIVDWNQGSSASTSFNLPVSVMDLDLGTSLESVRMTKGETRTLRIQVAKNGLPQNVDGKSFQFAAKRRHDDSTYTVSPVSGTVTDAAAGKVSFILTPDTVFNGVCEITMSAGAAKLVLTPLRGLPCSVDEDIIDA